MGVFETQEIAGLIFAWWGTDGREPQWRLPTDLSDQTGWSGLSDDTTFAFPGTRRIRRRTRWTWATCAMSTGTAAWTASGSVGGWGLSPERLRLQAQLQDSQDHTIQHGRVRQRSYLRHGYSFVEIREHTIGMDTRLWVLATPVDGSLIDLSLVSQVREIHSPRRWIAGLGSSL